MSNAALGWIEVAVATLFFGSNFVPVKRYETHDGMFYQWVMCSGIFMTGLLIQLFLFACPPDDLDRMGLTGDLTSDLNRTLSGRPDPYSVKFIPLASFGGALWATGNTLSVPAINSIGLGMALLTWGSSNMLMGWATGFFGIFHLPPDHLDKPALNIVGVSLAAIALAMYAFIKPANKSTKVSTSRDGQMGDVLLDSVLPEAVEEKRANKYIVGFTLAVVAGLLFGNTFTPPDYIRLHHKGPSAPIDYVFSHFIGIFSASTVWFLVYCGVMRGAPLINPRVVLPGFLSGIMWAVAQTSWFLANDALGGVSVAFPIITSGPGIISAMWGVFVFGEIQGKRNYLILCLAVSTAVLGCSLIAISK